MNINTVLRNDPLLCRHGAPMGSRSWFDISNPRLYVQRVRMVDGDYAPDGTYWGAGSREHGFMFCGFNDYARIFVRAKNRAAAVNLIRAGFPAATFYRE